MSFLRDLARRGGGAVLELACGTGRFAIPLAEAGFDVAGIDLAEPMLAVARRKAAAAGVTVEWALADMTAFDLGRRFGLVVLVSNTLCHLLDLAAFEGCMACVRRHLAPGGRFVIDVFVPDPRLLINAPDERVPFGRYDDPDGRGVVERRSGEEARPPGQDGEAGERRVAHAPLERNPVVDVIDETLLQVETGQPLEPAQVRAQIDVHGTQAGPGQPRRGKEREEPRIAVCSGEADPDQGRVLARLPGHLVEGVRERGGRGAEEVRLPGLQRVQGVTPEAIVEFQLAHPGRLAGGGDRWVNQGDLVLAPRAATGAG